jgi:hypothetical protein
MLRPEVNLPTPSNDLDAGQRLRVDSCITPGARRVVTRVRRLIPWVLAAAVSACGGVKIRSPISRGSDATAVTPAGPPATFVRSTSDAKSTRMFDVREGLKKEQIFKTATDMLAEKYSVDVADAHAGFLMTSWQSPIVHDGVPDLRYRTRIVIRFNGEEWKQASVRAEANWQRGEEWDVGYDVALLEAVSADLKSRLGKRVN